MTTHLVINGHEIIDLVATYPKGIRLSQLGEMVARRFGPSAVFHTCSRLGLDLDDLLVFLEARNKVRIVRGVVFPGGSPGCKGPG
jgi:probable metal-binding protein